MKTKIFAIVLIPVIIFIAYRLVDGVKGDIDLAVAIEKSEKEVENKLKEIREIEKAYFASNNEYVGNWDSLLVYLNEGKIYQLNKREIIEARVKGDPLLYTNTDSVRIEYDTLAVAGVIEKLFPKDKYPNFDPERIMYIPRTENKFEIFAGTVVKGGVTVNVVEVVDKFPVDKTRNDENQSRTRKFLRFGSRVDVTVTGNWE